MKQPRIAENEPAHELALSALAHVMSSISSARCSTSISPNRRWQAARNVADLIEAVPGGLERYRPQAQYLLIDEGEFEESELNGLRNLAAALFRLENSREPQDVERVLASLIEWLAAPAQSELRRAFTVWLKRVLLPARLPGIEIPQVIDLVEMKAMLAEHVKEWTKQWKQEGLLEGLKKGREEGRKAGQAEFLISLLERKFGPLAPEYWQRIRDAEQDALWQWAERALEAGTLDEVFTEGGKE